MKNNIISFDSEKIKEIEGIIHYEFKNKKLLEQAFTRSSYANEHKEAKSNELLEFIGDTILDDIIVKLLVIKKCNRDNEGLDSEFNEANFTDFKVALTQKTCLAYRIDHLGLYQYLRQSKSVKEEDSLKEDLFEAIVGAISLDCNYEEQKLIDFVNYMIDFEINCDIEFSQDKELLNIQKKILSKYDIEPSYQITKGKNILYSCEIKQKTNQKVSEEEKKILENNLPSFNAIASCICQARKEVNKQLKEWYDKINK